MKPAGELRLLLRREEAQPPVHPRHAYCRASSGLPAEPQMLLGFKKFVVLITIQTRDASFDFLQALKHTLRRDAAFIVAADFQLKQIVDIQDLISDPKKMENKFLLHVASEIQYIEFFLIHVASEDA